MEVNTIKDSSIRVSRMDNSMRHSKDISMGHRKDSSMANNSMGHRKDSSMANSMDNSMGHRKDSSMDNNMDNNSIIHSKVKASMEHRMAKADISSILQAKVDISSMGRYSKVDISSTGRYSQVLDTSSIHKDSRKKTKVAFFQQLLLGQWVLWVL